MHTLHMHVFHVRYHSLYFMKIPTGSHDETLILCAWQLGVCSLSLHSTRQYGCAVTAFFACIVKEGQIRIQNLT